MDFSLLAVSLFGVVAAVALLIDLGWRVHIATAHHARLQAARKTLRERAAAIRDRATELAKAKAEADRRFLDRHKEHDGLRRQIEEEGRRPGELLYVTSDAPVMSADRPFSVLVRISRHARNPVAAARFAEDRHVLIWSQNANQAMSYAEGRHTAFGEVVIGAALPLPAERLGLARWEG
jgi:hypothetical protein